MYIEALKQIFKITFTIILLIAIPVVLFTLISSKTSVNGIKSFVVLTGSMEPNVPVGSVIYTLKRSSYNIGDVIAFKQGDITVSHRVVAVTPKGYQTKGDANNVADSGLVSSSSIEGAKVYMLLNIGKLILALKTIPGFIVFIILPSLILIGFELWNIKKEFEKEIEKKIMKKVHQMQKEFSVGSIKDYQAYE